MTVVHKIQYCYGSDSIQTIYGSKAYTTECQIHCWITHISASNVMICSGNSMPASASVSKQIQMVVEYIILIKWQVDIYNLQTRFDNKQQCDNSHLPHLDVMSSLCAYLLACYVLSIRTTSQSLASAWGGINIIIRKHRPATQKLQAMLFQDLSPFIRIVNE